jgi:outer membrane lipoprotein-sorting protein
MRKKVQKICQDVLSGQSIVEYRPQPPFNKGGQGGFLARQLWQGKAGYWALLSLILSLALLIAVPAYAVDGPKLLVQIDRNLNPESYELYRKLINVEPDGKKKEYTLFSVKKGVDKVAAIFLAPASDKGRSTLRLGENMWLYIPNVGKPIRITSLQSVIGGVFNNADILNLDYSAEYNVENVDETGNEYLLHLKAKNKTVAYDRLKMWVDRDKKTPTKIECLTEAGMLIKTLYFKDIKDFQGGIVRPATIETDSPLYKGYKSVMLFAKIKKKDFKDEVFTLTFMPNMDSIR